jgi:hypothetical protein
VSVGAATGAGVTTATAASVYNFVSFTFLFEPGQTGRAGRTNSNRDTRSVTTLEADLKALMLGGRRGVAPRAARPIEPPARILDTGEWFI